MKTMDAFRSCARLSLGLVALLLLACGDGNSGGKADVWSAPACSTIVGSSSIAFSNDEAASVSPRSTPPTPGTAERVSGLIAMPGATNRLLGVRSTGLGELFGEVLVSKDAGCTWAVGSLRVDGVAELVATQFDLAYGWANLTKGDYFYFVRADGSGKSQSLDASTRAVAASPAERLTVWRMDIHGRLFRSTDGGDHWQSRSQVPFTTFGETVTDAVIDDLDPAHIVVGSDNEAWVTFDGGVNWSMTGGLTAPGGSVNVGSIAVAPTNHAILWASGLDITEHNANPPKGYRLWRSVDGGLTFTTVFDRSDATSPTIFGNLVPHPTNANVVYWHIDDPAFGVVALYKFDLASGLATAIAPPGIHGIQSLVFHPTLPTYMYFGLYWPG